MSGERYFDPTVQAWGVKVLPGKWHLSDSQDILAATIGCAVSLIVWDSAHNRAAMANIMVNPASEKNWTTDNLPCPVVDAILDSMWKALPLPPGEGTTPVYTASVIGGGIMTMNGQMVVGQAGVMKAVDWVHKHGIALDHYDVGQTIIRKVFFNPVNGDLTVRRIVITQNDSVRQREEAYLNLIKANHNKE